MTVHAEVGNLDPSAAGTMVPARFDAFISYSHADRQVAAGVQKGLARIGRRMGQLNALRIFRDATDLTASPDLWGKVADALAASRFLIVILSPASASSVWVDKEVAHWLDTRGPDQLTTPTPATISGVLSPGKSAAQPPRTGAPSTPPEAAMGT